MLTVTVFNAFPFIAVSTPEEYTPFAPYKVPLKFFAVGAVVTVSAPTGSVSPKFRLLVSAK